MGECWPIPTKKLVFQFAMRNVIVIWLMQGKISVSFQFAMRNVIATSWKPGNLIFTMFQFAMRNVIAVRQRLDYSLMFQFAMRNVIGNPKPKPHKLLTFQFAMRNVIDDGVRGIHAAPLRFNSLCVM